jgi:hypothetical protein
MSLKYEPSSEPLLISRIRCRALERELLAVHKDSSTTPDEMRTQVPQTRIPIPGSQIPDTRILDSGTLETNPLRYQTTRNPRPVSRNPKPKNLCSGSRVS